MSRAGAIAVVLACTTLGGSARADDSDDEPITLLGVRLGVGVEPIGASSLVVLSLAIAVDHPVWGKTRAFGEYAWLSLEHPASTMASDDIYATGHRLQAGLRRALVSHRAAGGKVQLFVDGELSGGIALVDDNVMGLHVLPDASVGLRAGVNILADQEVSPSRAFQPELTVRVLVTPDGTGWLTGVGFVWGN